MLTIQQVRQAKKHCESETQSPHKPNMRSSQNMKTPLSRMQMQEILNHYA